jgi:LexA DNA binding domain
VWTGPRFPAISERRFRRHVFRDIRAWPPLYSTAGGRPGSLCASLMTTPSSDDAERVQRHLTEFIGAKNYPPTIRQIAVVLGISHPRATSALKALDAAGKIRFVPAKWRLRPSITLKAPTQNLNIQGATQTPSTKPASPKPGQIICVQCRNPVCEKSKWYCDLHLRLNREAVKRYLDKKRRAGICLQCDAPAGPVSRVFCESHRKKRLEATAARADRSNRYSPVKVECTHEHLACQDCGCTISQEGGQHDHVEQTGKE